MQMVLGSGYNAYKFYRNYRLLQIVLIFTLPVNNILNYLLIVNRINFI